MLLQISTFLKHVPGLLLPRAQKEPPCWIAIALACVADVWHVEIKLCNPYAYNYARENSLVSKGVRVDILTEAESADSATSWLHKVHFCL